ncbi:hypothetical protein [Planctomyces sp. SH-PL14]|uniref:hypothetical protein n=1 Tax=Planctomyces sp. SH-PL14 TaxID=1632864 RepID=UPI00078C48AD|nr:hypothetical protein [Planctomyces sp. SH-PL14]AMV21752.1 hypothetical protein VT03_27875 [Planctomyces sp. SH-PL14]
MLPQGNSGPAWASGRFGISIVADPALLAQPVELKLQSATAKELLSAIAHQVGAQVTKSGGVYLLGTLRPEDRGAFVKRVRRLSEAQLREVCQQMLSDVGRVSAFKDGLVVVTDTVEVLNRVADLLESVEAAEAVTWVVQMHVVQLTDRDIRDLGLDTVPALEVAAVLGDASSGKLLSVETDLTASLKSVLQFANEKGRAGVLAEPLFLLVDGEEGILNRTRRVPVENSVIDPRSGAISRNYSFTEVGLQFRLTLRELNWKTARANIFISLGDVEAQGEEGRPPITRQQEMTLSADMTAGGVYLVGALRDGNSESSQKGGLKLGGVNRAQQTETLVFARVARVAAPVFSGPESERDQTSARRGQATVAAPVIPGAEPAYAMRGAGTGKRSELRAQRTFSITGGFHESSRIASFPQ